MRDRTEYHRKYNAQPEQKARRKLRIRALSILARRHQDELLEIYHGLIAKMKEEKQNEGSGLSRVQQDSVNQQF